MHKYDTCIYIYYVYNTHRKADCMRCVLGFNVPVLPDVEQLLIR